MPIHRKVDSDHPGGSGSAMAQELADLRAELESARTSISLLSEKVTTMTAAVNNAAGSNEVIKLARDSDRLRLDNVETDATDLRTVVEAAHERIDVERSLGLQTMENLDNALGRVRDLDMGSKKDRESLRAQIKTLEERMADSRSSQWRGPGDHNIYLTRQKRVSYFENLQR